ncbi:nuclear factor of activated T-cells 5-like [Limulus polyphemus]|uniref:Nuclear factor of activated T-cells 5-like n=1 Tax=Limulus polyphemus TaxID=6850 RepID=A0ABM1SBG6_LIMPO|nr:nuclear factor of activated T-cells 5-like [Limulus polyphemus]XP_022240967.1 nuclear factor of activated T-cells 5-like [Limulus polyphemus]XP_022240968.1 nuclear factor of activated T-cells 5-like [Limulus polyphemus]XP_022240969.1 nuclear factor of activated T-cells 5-like [Limulus polyphemus]XP_022240970.1 nuclear factor of activated T-cells 5-like [Limulus polyphemus]XP_022240971.1 nuclear factor of activated T-cells 5-like [Limulus polyphemus]
MMVKLRSQRPVVEIPTEKDSIFKEPSPVSPLLSHGSSVLEKIKDSAQPAVQSAFRNLKRANSCDDSISFSSSPVSVDSGTSHDSERSTPVFQQQLSLEHDSYCDPDKFILEILSMSEAEDSAISMEPPSKVPRSGCRLRTSSLSGTSECSVGEEEDSIMSETYTVDSVIESSNLTEAVSLQSSPFVNSDISEPLPASADSVRMISEEATLGDQSSTTQTKVQDFVQLHSALRALIREVSSVPEAEHAVIKPKSCVMSTPVADNSDVCKPPSYSPTAAPSASTSSKNHQRDKNVKKDSPPEKPTLCSSYPSCSKDGIYELKILIQPEQQHRARYLTEGSRGAVKDRKGTGYPAVKLFGYNNPVTVQVFIGTDQGKALPHLFYQASKVFGKSSTPCSERKIEGTSVLEIEMSPDKDMTVSCDCVGILKERNVDVEHRLALLGGSHRSKKRSTRCRIVFRVRIPQSNGAYEILQVASAPILCTQPPGVPEVSKKSLSECPTDGKMELFIIGKNFLKDTQVLFREVEDNSEDEEFEKIIWEKAIDPDKEYLQPTHLVCRVPPYRDLDIIEPVNVQLLVYSGGKTSKPHPFTYLPNLKAPNSVRGTTVPNLSPDFAQSAVNVSKHFRQTGVVPTVIQLPVITPGSGNMQGLQPWVSTVVIPGTNETVFSVAPHKRCSEINSLGSLSDGCLITVPDGSKPNPVQLLLIQQLAAQESGNNPGQRKEEKIKDLNKLQSRAVNVLEVGKTRELSKGKDQQDSGWTIKRKKVKLPTTKCVPKGLLNHGDNYSRRRFGRPHIMKFRRNVKQETNSLRQLLIQSHNSKPLGSNSKCHRLKPNGKPQVNFNSGIPQPASPITPANCSKINMFNSALLQETIPSFQNKLATTQELQMESSEKMTPYCETSVRTDLEDRTSLYHDVENISPVSTQTFMSSNELKHKYSWVGENLNPESVNETNKQSLHIEKDVQEFSKGSGTIADSVFQLQSLSEGGGKTENVLYHLSLVEGNGRVDNSAELSVNDVQKMRRNDELSLAEVKDVAASIYHLALSEENKASGLFQKTGDTPSTVESENQNFSQSKSQELDFNSYDPNSFLNLGQIYDDDCSMKTFTETSEKHNPLKLDCKTLLENEHSFCATDCHETNQVVFDPSSMYDLNQPVSQISSLDSLTNKRTDQIEQNQLVSYSCTAEAPVSSAVTFVHQNQELPSFSSVAECSIRNILKTSSALTHSVQMNSDARQPDQASNPVVCDDLLSYAVSKGSVATSPLKTPQTLSYTSDCVERPALTSVLTCTDPVQPSNLNNLFQPVVIQNPVSSCTTFIPKTVASSVPCIGQAVFTTSMNELKTVQATPQAFGQKSSDSSQFALLNGKLVNVPLELVSSHDTSHPSVSELSDSQRMMQLISSETTNNEGVGVLSVSQPTISSVTGGQSVNAQAVNDQTLSTAVQLVKAIATNIEAIGQNSSTMNSDPSTTATNSFQSMNQETLTAAVEVVKVIVSTMQEASQQNMCKTTVQSKACTRPSETDSIPVFTTVTLPANISLEPVVLNNKNQENGEEFEIFQNQGVLTNESAHIQGGLVSQNNLSLSTEKALQNEYTDTNTTIQTNIENNILEDSSRVFLSPCINEERISANPLNGNYIGEDLLKKPESLERSEVSTIGQSVEHNSNNFVYNWQSSDQGNGQSKSDHNFDLFGVTALPESELLNMINPTTFE